MLRVTRISDKNMHGTLFFSLEFSHFPATSRQHRRGALSVILSDGKRGIRWTAAAILLRRKIRARCGETVTYYSRATFHYTSFHSTPRAYYWHVFPLGLSRIPISRIGKFLFLFPPAVIRHATHVEATRSPIVLRQYVLYKCLMEKRRRAERERATMSSWNVWPFLRHFLRREVIKSSVISISLDFIRFNMFMIIRVTRKIGTRYSSLHVQINLMKNMINQYLQSYFFVEIANNVNCIF